MRATAKQSSRLKQKHQANLLSAVSLSQSLPIRGCLQWHRVNVNFASSSALDKANWQSDWAFLSSCQLNLSLLPAAVALIKTALSLSLHCSSNQSISAAIKCELLSSHQWFSVSQCSVFHCLYFFSISIQSHKHTYSSGLLIDRHHNLLQTILCFLFSKIDPRPHHHHHHFNCSTFITSTTNKPSPTVNRQREITRINKKISNSTVKVGKLTIDNI